MQPDTLEDSAERAVEWSGATKVLTLPPSTGGSTLSVVDAAYDLEAPDDEWLANLMTAAYAAFDRGFGVGAMAFEHGPGGSRYFGTSPVFVNPVPNLMAAMARGSDVSSAEDARAMIGPPCTSLSRSYRQVGDPEGKTMRRVFEASGLESVKDILIVNAHEVEGRTLTITIPVGRVMSPTPGVANGMARVARHIATALRLRHAIGADHAHVRSFQPDAVFDQRGACVHAEGDTRTPRELDSLTTAIGNLVRRREHLQRSDPDRVVDLWKALIAGRWSVVAAIDSDGRRHLLVKKNEPELPEPAALSGGDRHLLALFALGHSAKLVAYELGLSPSNVSLRLHAALGKLGMRSLAEFNRVFAARHAPVPPGGDGE